MKATLLRDKLTELIQTYGDVDVKVSGNEIVGFYVPSVRDFEKEDEVALCVLK